MDREGFRNRLKQYKEARGLNPLLKYWEWKALPAEKEVPKYEKGTNGVEEGLEEDTVMLPIESPILPQSHDPYYTQWQSDWLNHRRTQLFNNIKASHIPTTWYSKKPDLDDIDIRDQKYDTHKHGGDLFKYLYWGLSGYSTNRIAVNQEFYRQLNNAATAPEITLNDYDWNTAGVYVRPNILNGTGHYIAYVKNTELTHKIHERTHASHADPQEDAILKIIGGNNNRETPYLKRPTEVYSRLMQYRHDLKLDPKQVITDEYLNEHRDLLEEYDLNIFTDEQLLDIFNDVAYNATTSADDRLFLKNGGVVSKYEEGTGNVGEWDPRITAEGYDDKGYYAQAMNPLPEVVVTGSIELNKDLKRRLAISKYLMGQFANIGASGKYSYTPISTNLTQDIFLLSPEDQKKIMELHGWRKVDINNEVDPYGLVRSSAKYHLDTHNEVPIYENTIDSDTTITRDQLTHLFNVYTEDDLDLQYTNAFVNANGYPTAIYFNPKSGKFYSRSYDLNDYGPTNATSGFISTVNKLKRFAAKKLDEYGLPFVIRTGFEPLPQTMIDNFLANPEYGKIIERALNHNIHKSNKSDKNKSFADGGEVGDNTFMGQFGNQVSYKPEETGWWSDVKNWWNDLTGMRNYAHGNCATTPDGKHTTQCAHYSNAILRNQGYKNIVGDAWTRAAHSGMKKITSGYDGLTKPAKWDEDDAHEYLLAAAENFANKADTTALNSYDVIGLYYPDSPNTKKAFEQGKWGETQTHTGHIAIGKDGTHYVVHNVDGHLKINKLADMLTGEYEYKPVSAYRPRK